MSRKGFGAIPIVLILAAVLILAGGAWYYARHSGGSIPYVAPASPITPTSSAPTSTQGAPVAGPGERCGGNTTTAPVCAAGYHCAPDPALHLPFGDVGGKCVANVMSQSSGMLQGVMTIGPICPVEQAGHPCSPTPQTYAAHPVYVYQSDRQTLIVTLIPNANGQFQTTLPTGDYWIDVVHQSVGSVTGAPAAVRVDAGRTTNIAIDIDTGIR